MKECYNVDEDQKTKRRGENERLNRITVITFAVSKANESDNRSVRCPERGESDQSLKVESRCRYRCSLTFEFELELEFVEVGTWRMGLEKFRIG